MEQATLNRIRRAQIILLAAAFLLFLGGCGDESGEGVKAIGDMAVPMSGGVDIEHFGSEEWSGGEQSGEDTPMELSDETATVTYSGELFMKTAADIGGNSIYLAGFYGNPHDERSLEEKTSMDAYFTGRVGTGQEIMAEIDLNLPEDMYVVKGCVDSEGKWHMLLTQRIDGALTWEKSEIRVVNEDGETERIIDMTEALQQIMLPFWVAVDRQGNYYLANQGKLIVTDGQGKTKHRYSTASLAGMGIGKSGQIYAVISNDTGAHLGKLDSETGTIEECAVFDRELLSTFSILQPGTNTELLLANKGNGAFTYDGEKLELAVSVGSIMGNGQDIAAMGFLEDGRICVMGYEDDKILFHYVPVER